MSTSLQNKNGQSAPELDSDLDRPKNTIRALLKSSVLPNGSEAFLVFCFFHLPIAFFVPLIWSIRFSYFNPKLQNLYRLLVFTSGTSQLTFDFDELLPHPRRFLLMESWSPKDKQLISFFTKARLVQ